MPKEQAYRDPVHDFITLNDPLLLAVIDTPELQRLRRIRQLGSTAGTYHGAEHSRFGHALGAMWIMQKLLARLGELGAAIGPEIARLGWLAALLHDLGHGPFSHALEGVITPEADHESWTQRILLGESVVHAVLSNYDATLPGRVAELLKGRCDAAPFLPGLVAGQLDVDRMDYLLRDSLYTGVTYGRFDLDRLLGTLELRDGRVVVRAKGLPAVEEYVLARYFMYWQVYWHKTIRGQELLLRTIWQRARALAADGATPALAGAPPTLLAALVRPLALAEYLALDDSDVWVALKAWVRSSDPILADLARRFLARDLLKAVYRGPQGEMPSEAQLAEARQLMARAGYAPEYYLLLDRAGNVAYDPYVPPRAAQAGPDRVIWVLDEAGRPVELSQRSTTIGALAQARREAVNLYAPAAVIGRLRALFLGSGAA